MNEQTKQSGKNNVHNAKIFAYMGDAVFELYIRKMLINQGDKPLDELNKIAHKYVSAKSQAEMYKQIADHLTAEEQAIMRRGRNLHAKSKAKNADTIAYRHATGLETLFGYLFLQEKHERIKEIFELCIKINII
ncbi:MAG: ribonuclease III [Firmicutes bacterium]|nr:ribonuclease III [Bacillota bacterium]